MTNKRSGVIYLFCALVILLAVSLLAAFLGQAKQPADVSTIQRIGADYQTESAIMMILQKAHETPGLSEQKISKEIMPGIFLELSGTPETTERWVFKGTISGSDFKKNIHAHGSIADPSRIIFLP